MPDPVMQSPLHHLGLAARARLADANCGVWANEIPLLGYVSLRGDATDVAFVEAASRVLGFRLPTAPCTSCAGNGLTALWLSPDEWMLVGLRDRTAELAAALDEALAGIRSQVVTNSGGFTQIVVSGRDAERVLAHCTVYDVAKLANERVVGTTFGKSSVYLRREGNGFCLLLRRSFADYIWRFLERAATPYGFGVAMLGDEARTAAGQAP